LQVRPTRLSSDIESMGRRAALIFVVLAFVAQAASASARSSAVSWAQPQIETVVGAGLMAPSVEEFRPDDPLTATDFAVILASLGGTASATDPDRPVTMRELDAQLVTLAGLRPAARQIRTAALAAGLAPPQWLGTETVARLLGLRTNHPQADDALELELGQPATRAEAAYSIARLLQLDPAGIEAVREVATTFAVPPLDPLQRTILTRALKLVGSPYVWAGTSEKSQTIAGRLLPGGFDCSGLVWRVYKLQPVAGAPGLARVLQGRTTYAMSGEVPASRRIARDALGPADIVFFGARGTKSKPNEVGHMGIYLGNGWMVHSSGFGTTLTPMAGWYQRSFAWGRRPIAEAGLDGTPLATSGGAAGGAGVTS
jgi:cell wall-associated NlpC family hydrolase